MAANAALYPYPQTLTDRRNDITTLGVLSGSEGLSPRDVVNLRPAVVELTVDSGSLRRRVEFSVADTPTPVWFSPTLERGAHLLLLPMNWDSQGAPPIEPAFVQRAVDSLFLFMDSRSGVPQWTPTRDGGVQLDWHEAGIDLEIEFSPSAVGGYAVFSDLEGGIPPWNGPITANMQVLRQVFRERLLR